MSDRLPKFIDPTLLAESRRILTGMLKLSEFDRLSEVLARGGSDVVINLAFEKVGRLATVRGSIKVELMLQCQACLQAVLCSINTSVNLAVVSTSEQTDRLAEEFEPLWLESGSIPLKQLVEDELLLAIPDFPKHDYDCMERKQVVSERDNPQQRSDNPFSVLAKLKNTGE